MRIALSQRVDRIATRGERRDALDQRWAPLAESLGLIPIPVPNGLQAPQDWARALGIQGLLLSGGNDVAAAPSAHTQAPERDRTETALLQLADAARWPVLGVCRGLQMINVHLGGRLQPVPGHVAVRHRLRRGAAPARLLAALPDGLEVNSFHGFGIAADGLAAALQPVLHDAEGGIEAAEHRSLPWAGIMWHPEREVGLSPVDRALLMKLYFQAD